MKNPWRLAFILLVLGLLFSIEIPKFRQGEMAANERAAIRTIRAINNAEDAIIRATQYATPLEKLDVELAPDYNFIVEVDEWHYTVHAAPKHFNVDGRRTFYSDHLGEIYEHWGPEPATTSDPVTRAEASGSP